MNSVSWHRFQFGFLATFHYLFPALTMGLALLVFLLKLRAYRKNDPAADQAAHFWAKIFGINFVVGVVTGIPLEFQFGTNWAEFSNFSGGVIGLTLAMEGLFAFFAESAFLGLFLYGAHKLTPRAHLFTSFMVFAGSWLSGYFIVTTNAFMQHPVGYKIGPRGVLELSDMWGYLLNPWGLWQYLHNMMSSVITACFVVCAVGAIYILSGKHREVAERSMRTAVVVGLIACILVIFPTGDMNGKLVAQHQPAALAAMEGKFESNSRADLAIIGQPDMKTRKLENPIVVPEILSYLAYGSFGKEVKGMNDFPADELPDNVELLYFSYHIMAGLGTIFILLMGWSALQLLRGKLFDSRPTLWLLLLAMPFPYIATTMGWMTAELGRQPWTVYGLQRTEHAASPLVSAGSVVFSALGFMGLYFVVGVLFLYLVFKIIAKGPSPIHETDKPGPSVEAP